MGAFPDTLQAVIRRTSWDVDSQRQELANLNLALRERRVRMQALAGEIRALESQRAAMCRTGAIIDMDGKARLEGYLCDCRARLQSQGRDADRMQAMADQALRQLTEKRQALRGMERHRQRRGDEIERQAARRAMLAADEMWLLRLIAARQEAR